MRTDALSSSIIISTRAVEQLVVDSDLQVINNYMCDCERKAPFPMVKDQSPRLGRLLLSQRP